MNNKIKNILITLLGLIAAVIINSLIVMVCWNYCLISIFNLPLLSIGKCMLLTLGVTGIRYTLFYPINSNKK